jgi:hypothetical protein
VQGVERVVGKIGCADATIEKLESSRCWYCVRIFAMKEARSAMT